MERQLFNLALTLQQCLSLNFSPTTLLPGRNEKDCYYGGGHSAGLMSCESTAEESCVANSSNLNLHLSGPDFWAPAVRGLSLEYIFYT